MCAKLSRSNSSNAHIQWRTPSPNRNLISSRVMHLLQIQHDTWYDSSSPLSVAPSSCESNSTLSASSPSNGNNHHTPPSSIDSPHYPLLNRHHKSCNDIHIHPPTLIIPHQLESQISYRNFSSNPTLSKQDHNSNQKSFEVPQRNNNLLLQQQQHSSTTSQTSTTTPNVLLSSSPLSSTIVTTCCTTPTTNDCCLTLQTNELKMPPNNSSPPNLQVSPALSTSSDQQKQQGEYMGHSGKAYILVEKKSVNTNEGIHMVKCSLRLKEGKSLLIKKQSEHTLTFKITPFTCAKYTSLSSGSNQTVASRVLVTVSELSSSSLGDKSNNTVVGNNPTLSSSQPTAIKQAKQSYFVPELQFIFGSFEEAKEFSEKITNNVYCYCKDLVSNKIQKEVQSKAPISGSKPEGYIIRKNQKPHIKTYQKPSIVYAELLNKQLLFYTSHKKTKVADVIGCRVDFTREKYYTDYLSNGTQKNEHHMLAFTLNVGNEGESRETFAFPTSSDTQKWLSVFSNSTSPDVRVDDFDDGADQEEEERGSGDEGDGEELDDELAQLLGLGGDTVVIHTEVETKEDVVGDAVLELGEPDIFGKRKNNVFNDGFWQPPKNSTPSKSPSSVSTPPTSPVNNNSPLSEVQILKNRVAELEKLLEEKTRECTELRRELNK